MLDRARPDWYRNQHTTDQFGFELQSTIPNQAGELVLGGEVARDLIESSSLGDHDRTQSGLFCEQRFSFCERFSIIPWFSVYWHQDHGMIDWAPAPV